MSRDSEAPRDEPQPLTKEEREMHVNLSRRVVQAGYPTYSRGYVSDAAVILAYEALVQRLEAENARLRGVLLTSGRIVEWEGRWWTIGARACDDRPFDSLDDAVDSLSPSP